MYFKGHSGVVSPTDYNGNPISAGDILTTDTWDREDSHWKSCWPKWDKKEIDSFKNKPTFLVKKRPDGFYYAEGLDIYLYLHDFRFKFTKKVF